MHQAVGITDHVGVVVFAVQFFGHVGALEVVIVTDSHDQAVFGHRQGITTLAEKIQAVAGHLSGSSFFGHGVVAGR